MKRLIILSIIVVFHFTFAQEKEEPVFLSSFNIGFYGGINFKSTSEIGGSFIIEGKTTLISNLNLKISVGYTRTYQPVSYQVNTYNLINIQGTNIWEAISYNVYEKGYDILPIEIGFQYKLKSGVISPYILFEYGYNSIKTITYSSRDYTNQYSTFDELPEKFRTIHVESTINSSSKIAIGVGTIYSLTSTLNLDVRYKYQFDNKIINTHQFLLGIYF